MSCVELREYYFRPGQGGDSPRLPDAAMGSLVWSGTYAYCEKVCEGLSGTPVKINDVPVG